ncbi:MAG: hypothetical protein LBR23_09150 [Spirochaetaceae bacterium]|jgi:hypothetical protein|nr:hypothetical protein [Spirochaetaceae bacterium]
MNEKTCAAMMDVFFGLDKNERYPLKLTLHLLACKTCRTQVRLCTLAERALAAPVLRPVPQMEADALTERVARAFPRRGEGSPISLRRWIVSGAAMILAMMLFTLVSPQSAGNHLQLAFYLVFGCVVTAYCALFIAGNMDFFVKKIETLGTR